VPPDQRLPLLKSLHSVNGHRGARSLLELLRPLYYWHGMAEDATAVVDACPACDPARLHSIRDPEMTAQPIADNLAKWYIDNVGPFKACSRTRHTNIVVGIDSGSKTVAVMSSPDKTALSALHFLQQEIVYRYGCPIEVVTDNGSEFKAEFALGCRALNIMLSHGRAYHPMSQGLVERAMRPLQRSVQAIINSSPDGAWSHRLVEVAFSFNSAIQASTRFSPFRVLHGVEPRLPLALKPADMPILPVNVTSASMTARERSMERDHAQKLQNVEAAQVRQTASFNARRTTIRGMAAVAATIAPGTMVYLKRKRAKKNSPALGPYEVIQMMPDGVHAQLKDGQGQAFEATIDIIQLGSMPPGSTQRGGAKTAEDQPTPAAARAAADGSAQKKHRGSKEAAVTTPPVVTTSTEEISSDPESKPTRPAAAPLPGSQTAPSNAVTEWRLRAQHIATRETTRETTRSKRKNPEEDISSTDSETPLATIQGRKRK